MSWRFCGEIKDPIRRTRWLCNAGVDLDLDVGSEYSAESVHTLSSATQVKESDRTAPRYNT